MSRVVAALALIAAVAGLTACGPTATSEVTLSASSAESSPADPGPAGSTNGSGQATSAGPSAAPPQPEQALAIALTVTAGDVSGPTGRVVVELGSEVRIEVKGTSSTRCTYTATT